LLELDTVLIVDDSPVARSLLARLLRSYCREIVELNSTEEAKLALSQHPNVSLVVVDTRAGGNGMELLEYIARFAAERPPVIVLTARPDLEEETRATLLGAIGYIAKPVSLREILRALRGFERSFTPALPRVKSEAVAQVAVVDPQTKIEEIAWDVWDMSASGALVSSHAPIPIGTRLQLCLQLGDETVPVEAEVVRAQEPSWGLVPGVGVVFHFDDERQQEAVRRFIESKAK
jgi:DNA-binding response OmpR family regulator